MIFTNLFRADWKPTAASVTRTCERLRDCGFDTTRLEPGLLAMAGGPREPGDDAEPEPEPEPDEDDLAPLSAVLTQIQTELTASNAKKSEATRGRTDRLKALIDAGASARR